jgi:polar amino acid transport system substrate-binding protein
MRLHILFALLFLTGTFAQAGDTPADVLVLTGGRVTASGGESLAPPAGYGREVIQKLMLDAGLSYLQEPQPFARALKTLDTNPDAVLFPMLRTPERESKYQWIGLLAKRNYYLYRSASRKDIVIRSLEDAKQYRIGVLRGDVRTDYLRAQGFTEGTAKGLEVVNVTFSVLKMQQAGRIDLIVYSDEGVKLACEEANISCDSLVPAFQLDLAGGLWLVASPLMPHARVDTLRKAFKRQEDSGYLGKLMKSGRSVGG